MFLEFGCVCFWVSVRFGWEFCYVVQLVEVSVEGVYVIYSVLFHKGVGEGVVGADSVMLGDGEGVLVVLG